MKTSIWISLKFNCLLLWMKSAVRCSICSHLEYRVVCGIVVHDKEAVSPHAHTATGIIE